MSTSPKPEERASLHGLTPEEALRALLAVDPSGPDDEGQDDDADDGQDGSTSGR